MLGNINVLDSIDNLTGWLYTVTKNKIIDWYRKKRLKTVSLDQSVENGIRFEDILAEVFPDPLDDSIRFSVYQSIMECIDLLPEKQKYVFVQQVIEERTFEEIAKETGEPLNTLIARKHYAIRFLRDRLKGLKEQIYER
jgi:RNA polymerase sigma factor (sigma-70 family)